MSINEKLSNSLNQQRTKRHICFSVCRANCRSCQDSHNCDVCEENYFLLDGVFSKCVHTCPVGYLPDNTQSLGMVCKTGTMPFIIMIWFPVKSRNLLSFIRTLRSSSHNLLDFWTSYMIYLSLWFFFNFRFL